MRSFHSFILASLVASLAACSPYSPDLGGAPFQCGAEEPKCPEGYACNDDGTGRMVCFSETGGVIDAGPIGFQCADDSILEGAGKNDTIQTAYATPVQAQFPMITLASLALCPEGDKDTYAITISRANSNLEVSTSWESGMPVSVSILGSGGAMLGNSMSSGPMSQRAYVANLPVGTYYAQAYGAANVKNNYKIAIVTN
ncbi:MAG: hypothetical protein JWP01_3150 [Myxococcales bacterium]|nr:hypothetical protein [Myxococcales bacterium]